MPGRHTLLGNELCRNRTGLRFSVRSFGCALFYYSHLLGGNAVMTKKRIMQICITIICILSLLVLPAHAASSKYTIPELDLTLSIPTEYDVFTLDMSSNDPLFSDYGTTKADLDAQFAASSIYLDAISTVRNEEIVVTMTDSPLPNLNGMGDTTLMTLAAALVNEYTNYGITVTDYDISGNEIILTVNTDNNKLLHIGLNAPSLHIQEL